MNRQAIDDLHDIVLVLSRKLSDNGNRTSHADLLEELGITATDLEGWEDGIR